MSEETPTWLLPTVVALAAAAALWYFQSRPEPPTQPIAVTQPAVVADEQPDGPRYPLPLEPPEAPAQETLQPLPALGDSDSYFELALVDLYGTAVGDWLVNPALIEKVVATVDSLPGSQVAERIRPLSRLPESFAVDGQDDSGEYTPGSTNYARFDPWMAVLAETEADALAETYRRFYPLFQEAYVNLGYPDGYFNDRLVEVIDHLLEAPVLETPPELSRPNVLYEYADPALEELSAGQKALLRMGPRHGAQIKRYLEAFRDAIAGPDPAGAAQ